MRSKIEVAACDRHGALEIIKTAGEVNGIAGIRRDNEIAAARYNMVPSHVARILKVDHCLSIGNKLQFALTEAVGKLFVSVDRCSKRPAVVHLDQTGEAAVVAGQFDRYIAGSC